MAGFLIDRFGRRVNLYISLAIAAVLNLFLLLPHGLFGLGILRFLMGLPFAMITIGNSTLRTDIIPEDKRAVGFSITTISIVVSALVIGPNLGYWVLEWSSFGFLFPLASILILVALIIFSTMGFEDIKTKSNTLSINEIIEPRVLWFALVQGLYFIGWPSILTFGPLYAREIGLDFIGNFYLVYGIGLLLSRPVSQLIQKDRMPISMNAISIAIVVLGHTIIGFFPTSTGFLIGAVFLGTGYGLCSALLQKLAFDLVKPEQRGRCSGTLFIGKDIGNIIGMYAFAFTAQAFGSYSFSYLMTAIVTLAPLLLLIFVALPDYQQKHH